MGERPKQEIRDLLLQRRQRPRRDGGIIVEHTLCGAPTAAAAAAKRVGTSTDPEPCEIGGGPFSRPDAPSSAVGGHTAVARTGAARALPAPVLRGRRDSTRRDRAGTRRNRLRGADGSGGRCGGGSGSAAARKIGSIHRTGLTSHLGTCNAVKSNRRFADLDVGDAVGACPFR